MCWEEMPGSVRVLVDSVTDGLLFCHGASSCKIIKHNNLIDYSKAQQTLDAINVKRVTIIHQSFKCELDLHNKVMLI